MIKARFIVYGNESTKPVVDIHGDIRQIIKDVDKWTTALGFKKVMDTEVIPKKVLKKEFSGITRGVKNR